MADYTLLLESRFVHSLADTIETEWATLTLSSDEVEAWLERMRELAADDTRQALVSPSEVPSRLHYPALTDEQKETLFRKEGVVEVGPGWLEGAGEGRMRRPDEVRMTNKGVEWKDELPGKRGSQQTTTVTGPGPLTLEWLTWYETTDEEMGRIFGEAVERWIEVETDEDASSTQPYSAAAHDRVQALLTAALGNGLRPDLGEGRHRLVLPCLAEEDLKRLWAFGQEQEPFFWTYDEGQRSESLSLRQMTERVRERRGLEGADG